jgi:antitoxin component YwqK of YwqJK toxin-antitoxin module
MKPVLLSLALALLMVGCGESSNPSESVDMNETAPKKDAIETAVDYSKLQNRNGLKYLPNEETPFTGRAERLYDNGQKQGELNYKDGKYHGLWTSWYENGQKETEGNWKDGKLMSMEVWEPNGEKCPVTNVKDGNGGLVLYMEDGMEKVRMTYKDGKVVD